MIQKITLWCCSLVTIYRGISIMFIITLILFLLSPVVVIDHYYTHADGPQAEEEQKPGPAKLIGGEIEKRDYSLIGTIVLFLILCILIPVCCRRTPNQTQCYMRRYLNEQ